MSGAELTNPHIDPLVDKVAQILHTHVAAELCSHQGVGKACMDCADDAGALLPLVVAEVRSAAATAWQSGWHAGFNEGEALATGKAQPAAANPYEGPAEVCNDPQHVANPRHHTCQPNHQRANPYRVEEAPPAEVAQEICWTVIPSGDNYASDRVCIRDLPCPDHGVTAGQGAIIGNLPNPIVRSAGEGSSS